MKGPFAVQERRSLTRCLRQTFALSPTAAAEVIGRIEHLIDVHAAPDWSIARDEVIPRDAKKVFMGLQRDIGRARDRWEQMGERARDAVGCAALRFAQEQLTARGGYPSAVSREDFARSEFFSAIARAFGRNPPDAAEGFGAIVELLREIVEAANEGIRDLPRNAAAATDRRVAFLANALRMLPLDGRPAKYVDTQTAAVCEAALAAFDRELAAHENARILPEGSPPNFRQVYFAAIDLAFR